jgi:hypothetical protein
MCAFCDIWDRVYHNDKANMALYDFFGRGGLQVQDNTIYFGTTESFQVRPEKYRISESFLRLKLPRRFGRGDRYKDVDVSAKIEIEGTVNDDVTHWFGITTRALRTDHWDAYLFYIRKDGRIEFGIRGHSTEKPPPAPAVSCQPVTIRIRAEGDRVQTWVNDSPRHDWRDEQREFIRKGDIYLISYGALIKIYEVDVRVKIWYAPFLRFLKRFWKILVVLAVIVTLIVGIPSACGYIKTLLKL